jgi:hypothetical protein
MLKKIRARYEAVKADYDLDNTDMALVTLYGTLIVGTLGLAAYAGVQEAKNNNRRADWAASEIEAGRQIYQLTDGSLISTESAHWSR